MWSSLKMTAQDNVVWIYPTLVKPVSGVSWVGCAFKPLLKVLACTGAEVRGFAFSVLMLLSYHQKGGIPLTTISYIHLTVFKMLFETENLSN